MVEILLKNKNLRLKIFFLVFSLFLFFEKTDEIFAFTCTAAAGGGNWSAAATWTGCNSTIPQTGDDVVLNGTSGSVAVDAATAALNSFDMTGYAGTLSGASTITVSPASGSTAATFAGTITWTGLLQLNPATGATVTLTSNGKSLGGGVTIGSGSTQGTVVFADGLTIPASKWITVTSGVLHADGAADNSGLTHSWGVLSSSNSNTRSIYLGASNITLTSSSATLIAFNTTTNLTFAAGTSAITISGGTATVAVASTAGSAQTFYSLVFTGNGTMTINALNSTTTTLSITGPATTIGVLSFAADFAVTGTLTINGNSAKNRYLVTSNTLGTARTLNNTGATMSLSYVDFRDIALTSSYDCSAITGLCGDAGGNSGLTFTSATTTYATGTGSVTWSTHAWSVRVPLPQDDVVINNAFVSGITISIDMARAGHTIDLSGATWSGTAPTFTVTNSAGTSIYGSLKLPAGITITGTTRSFAGRSGTAFANGTATSMPVAGWQIVTAGNSMGSGSGSYSIDTPNGTYQLQDSFIYSGTSSFTLTQGTLDTNNFNFTVLALVVYNNATATVNAGSSVFTITGTGANTWNIGASATFNAGTSAIIISNTSATAKTFTSGGAKTYNIVTFSGDNITVAGSATFATMNVNNAGLPNGLKLTSGTTQTVTNITTNASKGLIAFLSATPSGNATITRATGIFCGEYMNIASSTVTTTSDATWYAANSTDVGNNVGWNFSQCPSPNTGPRTTSGPANEKVKGGIKVRGGVKFR